MRLDPVERLVIALLVMLILGTVIATAFASWQAACKEQHSEDNPAEWSYSTRF